MPCLPSAARRKRSWKSPSLLWRGQGSLADLWGCLRRVPSEVTLHGTPSTRRAAWVQGTGTLGRNQGGDQTSSQQRRLEEQCAIVWKSSQKKIHRKDESLRRPCQFFFFFQNDYQSNYAPWKKKEVWVIWNNEKEIKECRTEKGVESDCISIEEKLTNITWASVEVNTNSGKSSLVRAPDIVGVKPALYFSGLPSPNSSAQSNNEKNMRQIPI